MAWNGEVNEQYELWVCSENISSWFHLTHADRVRMTFASSRRHCRLWLATHVLCIFNQYKMVKMSASVNVSGMVMAHRLLMLLMSEPCDDFIFIFQLFPEMRHLLHQFLHLTCKYKTNNKIKHKNCHKQQVYRMEKKTCICWQIFRPKWKTNSPWVPSGITNGFLEQQFAIYEYNKVCGKHYLRYINVSFYFINYTAQMWILELLFALKTQAATLGFLCTYSFSLYVATCSQRAF